MAHDLTARSTRRATALCALLVGLVCDVRAGAAAPPDAGWQEAATPLSIVVVQGGTLVRVHIESGQLVARNATGETTAERPVSTTDHERVLAAARLCEADARPRNSCSGDETFVSVTVDGRTNSSAICGSKSRHPSGKNAWQALVNLLRGLMKA